MAIVRSVRRINPLDANKNVLTIGVSLPLNSTNMFEGTPTTRQQVKTNLLNLILTEQGERLMHPNYGMGVKNLLFEQNIDLENLKAQIHQQINFYIPEINLIDTEVATSEDKHTIQIKIKYNIKDNSGIPDAILININDPFESYREDESFFTEGRSSLSGHITNTEYVDGTYGNNTAQSYTNTDSINSPFTPY